MNSATVESVLGAAMLGSARSGNLEFEAQGALAETLFDLRRADPDQRLLDTVATVLFYERAGKLAARTEGIVATIQAPPESLKTCSEAATILMASLLAGSYPAVFPEALSMLRRARLIVPPLLLPELLSAGASQQALRDKILPVIGERGAWLAELNSAWSYAAGSHARTDDAVDLASLSATWSTMNRSERIAVLGHLRAREPAAARSLLLGTWKEESAADRDALIRVLQIRLSDEDEPFLESALDDRSVVVCRTAADLLSLLPNSRLVQNATRVAGSFLSVRRNFLGQKELIVRPPETFERSWLRDGIVEKSWIKDVGERAWYLIQWLGLVPPAYWSTAFDESPKRLLELSEKTDWADALRLGWSKGAKNSSDEDWKFELAKYWALARDNRTTISSFQPRLSDLKARGDELILTLMEIDPEPLSDSHLAVSQLLQNDGRWGHELARRVLESLERSSSLPESPQRSVWQTQTLLKSAALSIPLTYTDDLPASWADSVALSPSWKRAVDEFHSVLDFRRKLHKEILQ